MSEDPLVIRTLRFNGDSQPLLRHQQNRRLPCGFEIPRPDHLSRLSPQGV